MNEKKTIFCEIDFLEKYNNSRKSDSLFDNANMYDLLEGVGKCIRKSLLMIDVDESTFEKNIHTYPGILNLVKKRTQGECKCLEEHPYKYAENINADPKMRAKTPCLINKVGGICKSFAGKYGMIVLSPVYWSNDEEANKHTYLFTNSGVTINEGDTIKWENILKPEYNLSNCNSMIIIDNYILKSMIDLKHILSMLLPEPLTGGLNREDKFYITIITAKAKKEGERNDEAIYNQLKSTIKELRPNLNHELDIFVEQQTSSNTFHDRYILTNNVLIRSGGGFGLSGKNGRSTKQTKIDIIHPYIQSFDNSCDSEYSDIIKRAYYKIIKCTNTGQWKHYPANERCRNRLLCE